MSYRAYLGDSVYVDKDSSGMLVLYTNNGMGSINTIYLEPEVIENLLVYLKKHYNIDYKVKK